MGLADVCELLGTASPKHTMDGSGVAAAVADGRIEHVVAYCEADALATLRAYQALVPFV